MTLVAPTEILEIDMTTATFPTGLDRSLESVMPTVATAAGDAEAVARRVAVASFVEQYGTGEAEGLAEIVGGAGGPHPAA